MILWLKAQESTLPNFMESSTAAASTCRLVAAGQYSVGLMASDHAALFYDGESFIPLRVHQKQGTWRVPATRAEVRFSNCSGDTETSSSLDREKMTGTGRGAEAAWTEWDRRRNRPLEPCSQRSAQRPRQQKQQQQQQQQTLVTSIPAEPVPLSSLSGEPAGASGTTAPQQPQVHRCRSHRVRSQTRASQGLISKKDMNVYTHTHTHTHTQTAVKLFCNSWILVFSRHRN